MKYRLKKDLPFAKAGEEVTIETGEAIIYLNENREYACSYIGIKILIEDGWIEEIKPREWIIEKSKAPSGFECLRPIDAKGKLYYENSEIIKVREVIE